MRSRGKILYIASFISIILLLVFALPTYGIWELYPQSIFSKTSNSYYLTNYQHPLIPEVKKSFEPILSAQNYIMIDVATNAILISNNPSSRIYPASTTKLATALTALNIYPLEEVITVNNLYTEGKVMELKLDERITVNSLVDALLVYSANDAAFNLAGHHRDGIPGFVNEMNLLVTKYGLKNTHFTNFDGIHNPNHYSTVYDLSQIGRLAIKSSVIRDTVKKKKLAVSDITGKTIHNLTSTNELLDSVPEIQGLKTGWTPEAQGSFVSLIDLNGHLLIGVVAASQDRFADTVKLINWAKQSLTWKVYQP